MISLYIVDIHLSRNVVGIISLPPSDTDQLFHYLLNIQKMCYQNKASVFFKMWTFFRCFDTYQLFYSLMKSLKMCLQNKRSGFFKVWTFFMYFDRDLRELKQKNKFDTD